MLTNSQDLLRLLQLVNPALPVGAYSYSEGLETLVQAEVVMNGQSLEQWLSQELRYGVIRLEAIALLRAYQAVQIQHLTDLNVWNQWLSALRETEELREQSWQMGRSLTRLLLQLQPEIQPLIEACGEPCNFAIAFALAASYWQIDPKTTVLAISIAGCLTW